MRDSADMKGGALVYGRLQLAPVPVARIDQLRQMVQKQWKENKERRERPPPKERRKKNTDAMQSNKPGALHAYLEGVPYRDFCCQTTGWACHFL